MVKINKINKFYDGLFLRLIHHRHLELNLTAEIYLANGGKPEGLKHTFY